MIIHLLRLIWNGKKRNSLLAFQLFIGFLLLFILITLASHNIRKYVQPLGFQYQNRLIIKCSWPNEYKLIYEQLASNKSIVVSSVSSGAPYFPSGGSATLESKFTGKKVDTEEFYVDLAYKDVLGLTLAEGRWFNESDMNQAVKPVIISSAFRKSFFGDAGLDSKGWHIVGVLKNFRRQGELEGEINSRIHLTKPEEGGYFIIQVPPDSGIKFEEQLVSKIKSVAPKVSVTVTRLEDKRAEYLKGKLTPLMAIAGVGIFLFVNVILGLFGVLWYSISQRTTEIGIRRAVGATAKDVASQFVSEMLILASIGILPGIVVALQVQVFNLFETSPDIYILGIVLTALLIYALVSLCAVIPGLKSAKIQPVQALSEE